MKSLLTMQVGAFIGGFILFVEFIGDRGIDPQVGDKTMMLRGLVLGPIVWTAAGLSFVPSLRRHVETIALVALLLAIVCLVVILSMLKNGFDNFALAPILVFLLRHHVRSVSAAVLHRALRFFVGDVRARRLSDAAVPIRSAACQP